MKLQKFVVEIVSSKEIKAIQIKIAIRNAKIRSWNVDVTRVS